MKFESNLYNFLRELQYFEYRIECLDKIWEIIFPNQKDKYSHIRVTKYREVYYLIHIDGKNCTLEVTPRKSVGVMESFSRTSYDDGRHDPAAVWNEVIINASKWLQRVKKDWIKANRQMHESYPLNCRFGIVPNSLIRASMSDFYQIDKELGKDKTKKFINLVECGHFLGDKNSIRESMSADDFFDYCKLAYIAGQREDENVDQSLSGRELYKRYADGRDEGLLSIHANSKEEFADWIDGNHKFKSGGGHPWEIKRGGNTTHISLYVSRPSYSKEGFKIQLRGASIGRLKETICMFLAIHDAGLPITIDNPEGIRKRLIAEDNIGIMPSYCSLHRGNQHFHKDQHVFDVLHFDDLGKYKRRIKPFVTWEQLPILRPKHGK